MSRTHEDRERLSQANGQTEVAGRLRTFDPDEHTHQIAHSLVQQLDQNGTEKSATIDRQRNVGDRFFAHV